LPFGALDESRPEWRGIPSPGGCSCLWPSRRRGQHPRRAETGERERAQWVANLDAVAALEPSFVVAGHKKVENGNDPKIIAESQQYLRDFSRERSVMW
jgi:hypothetical protein